jgi:hypothetical protein
VLRVIGDLWELNGLNGLSGAYGLNILVLALALVGLFGIRELWVTRALLFTTLLWALSHVVQHLHTQCRLLHTLLLALALVLSWLSGINGLIGLSWLNGLIGLREDLDLSWLSGLNGLSWLSGLNGLIGLSRHVGLSWLSGLNGLSDNLDLSRRIPSTTRLVPRAPLDKETLVASFRDISQKPCSAG